MKDINRRKFITNSAGLVIGGSMAPLAAMDSQSDMKGTTLSNRMNKISNIQDSGINSIPNFCSHEHWGSISSIGMTPEKDGFRCDISAGALPLRPTSIWDLLLDPYEEGWLIDANRDPNLVSSRSGYPSMLDWWHDSPADALKGFQSSNKSLLLTGGFQCTRIGLKYLYNIDIASFDLDAWKLIDSQISKNYAGLFSWYKSSMAKAHFSELIRPVHPEFYVQQDSEASKEQELEFTHTILRIDPLTDLWPEKSKRREDLARIVGIDPVDASSWREFITRIFNLAEKNHTTGIKQLQAYRRTLNFQHRTDKEVVFRGNLSDENITVFQDWVVHECCKQAHERKWVHQVHVGTNNIGSSSPMPLEALAKRYPQMNIVMIHCWPFLKEAGWLAKFIPNMYIDTCWLPVLNPAFLREALSMWIGYVPSYKIMLAHDSTTIEMATGSSLFTREILAETLQNQQKSLQLPSNIFQGIAADMLNNNAVHLYKVGNEFAV